MSKNVYIGIPTQIPVYDKTTVSISNQNLTDYFIVLSGDCNDSGWFILDTISGSYTFSLEAKVDMELNFSYEASAKFVPFDSSDYGNSTANLTVGSESVVDFYHDSTSINTPTCSLTNANNYIVKKGDRIYGSVSVPYPTAKSHSYLYFKISSILLTPDEPTDYIIKEKPHLIKSAYVGVPTEVPIYKEEVIPVSVNSTNQNSYFSVDGAFFNDAGELSIEILGTTPQSQTFTLTAQKDAEVSFEYEGAIGNYPENQMPLNYIEVRSADGTQLYYDSVRNNNMSGNTIHSLQSGCVITGRVNTSVYGGDAYLKLKNLCVYDTQKVVDGTEIKVLPRCVKKIYIGDSNDVARLTYLKE